MLVAEQSSGRTGLAPFFALSHLLIASVEQSMEEEGEEVHLSEYFLRADRGTMTSLG